MHGGNVLGWEIFVSRTTGDKKKTALAKWSCGVFGLSWLDDLVKAGKAVSLGGQGYPCKYIVSARVLIPAIKNGVPKHNSPLIIGDDYVLPEGWSSDIEWDKEQILACAPDELLEVEAWDQS